MKATLIIEGKEIEIEISEEEYKKLHPSETGYERVPENSGFYYVSGRGDVESGIDEYCWVDYKYYESANYYSSDFVAENNARADKLLRQLRRFAVQHREREVNFNNTNTKKYCIYYEYGDDKLRVSLAYCSKFFGAIYFDSEETAQAAIDKFHDELIWYFNEYKDSL